MISPFWKSCYDNVCSTLKEFREVSGVVSVFNSNIDAIVKVDAQHFASWCNQMNCSPEPHFVNPLTINSESDFLEGFLHCFSKGIAQELLISHESLFLNIHKVVGYDHLQMGGQGGIIGNVMSVSGVQNVMVHAASLSKEQAQLFLPNENLVSSLPDGTMAQASKIHRSEDLPLIHWILEFNKGDKITINDVEYCCPKSNRFIATWDPQNFKLAIDQSFIKMVEKQKPKIDYVLLAGYQMLTEPLADGGSALERIHESKQIVDQWRESNKDMIVHFEFASTQDRGVRKMLFAEMSPWADSMGLNEQELIDILEVIGEEATAKRCEKFLDPSDLTEALILLFNRSELPRIQLHFYGMYITIRKRNQNISVESVQNGMALAATVAASKAKTGAINTEDSLLSAAGCEISGVSLDVLNNIGNYISTTYGESNFNSTGIYRCDEFELICMPTILIDNPVTLVGMGDTISSISLVSAK